MRLLVCGGRDFSDWDLLRLRMDQVDEVHRVEVVVHGAARGADSLAGRWARERGREELALPAEWEKFGRRAGPLRNAAMLVAGRPDLLLAFPGGVGTGDMVRRAVRAGVVVWHASAEVYG